MRKASHVAFKPNMRNLKQTHDTWHMTRSYTPEQRLLSMTSGARTEDWNRRHLIIQSIPFPSDIQSKSFNLEMLLVHLKVLHRRWKASSGYNILTKITVLWKLGRLILTDMWSQVLNWDRCVVRADYNRPDWRCTSLREANIKTKMSAHSSLSHSLSFAKTSAVKFSFFPLPLSLSLSPLRVVAWCVEGTKFYIAPISLCNPPLSLAASWCDQDTIRPCSEYSWDISRNF